MSSVRSTAAMASLPQISFCSGPATGASARTVGERFSLAFMGVPVIRYDLGEADHSSPLIDRAIEGAVASDQLRGAASVPTAAKSASTDSRERLRVMNTMRERRSSLAHASSVTGG